MMPCRRPKNNVWLPQEDSRCEAEAVQDPPIWIGDLCGRQSPGV
jgi:hypothetical protein